MNQSKFYEFKNSISGANEILIYGAIVGERGWWDGDKDVAPADFIEQLDALNGADILVRINSGGGDVFAAHAIHNLLIDYKGNVDVIVDGLCASAATIIAMAGKTITMPTNSLMMIHNPMVGLSDYYNEQELEALLPTLKAIKQSIIGAYTKRCKCSEEELIDMMNAETWLTAEECVGLGLADKIAGTIDSAINGKYLVVNSTSFDTAKFKNMAALKARVGKEKNAMTESMLQRVLDALGIKIDSDPVPAANNAPTASEPVPAPVDVEAVRAEAVAAERARMTALDALCDGNDAVLAIVNVAKANGATAEDVQIYVDAIKASAAQAVQPAIDNVNAMIADNAASGVDNIAAEPKKEDDKLIDQTASIDALVNAMKQINGGK